MNEVILKQAKFYLYQYAERIADDMSTINQNIENNDRILRTRQADDWYTDILVKRQEESKKRFDIKQKSLDSIDKCVEYFDTLIK